MEALNIVEQITVKVALNNLLEELRATYRHNPEALAIAYDREQQRVNAIIKKLEL